MKILQVLFTIVGFAVFANAQTAVLTGRIFDANGAVIVKSKVTAVNQKGENFVAFTNEDGFYKLNLPYNKYKPTFDFKIAKYDITVEGGLTGFERFTLKGFKVVGEYNGQMQIDFALDALSSSGPITVTTKKLKLK